MADGLHKDEEFYSESKIIVVVNRLPATTTSDTTCGKRDQNRLGVWDLDEFVLADDEASRRHDDGVFLKLLALRAILLANLSPLRLAHQTPRAPLTTRDPLATRDSLSGWRRRRR